MISWLIAKLKSLLEWAHPAGEPLKIHTKKEEKEEHVLVIPAELYRGVIYIIVLMVLALIKYLSR